MADRFYGVEFGGDKVSVVEGGSSTATLDVELRITYDAAGATKAAVIEAMRKLEQRFVEDTWPPA